MKIIIDEYCKYSFSEYAKRIGIEESELMLKTFQNAKESRDKKARERIESVLNRVDKGNESKDDFSNKGFEYSSSITSQKFWSYIHETIEYTIKVALDDFTKIIKASSEADFKSMNQVGSFLYKKANEFIENIEDLTIRIDAGWGRSVNFNHVPEKNNELTLSYDFQLSTTITQLTKFLIRLITQPDDNGDYRFITNEEFDDLTNGYRENRLFFVAFLLGEIEVLNEEFDYDYGEETDGLKNMIMGFRFVLFHEICHFLMKDVSGIDKFHEENFCDEFAALVFNIAMNKEIYDWVESGHGILCLFYLLHLKKNFIDIKKTSNQKNYLEPKIRFGIAFSRLKGIIESRYNHEDFWYRLDVALYDYMVVLKIKKNKLVNVRYEGYKLILSNGLDEALIMIEKGVVPIKLRMI